jgi:hypothetical protein
MEKAKIFKFKCPKCGCETLLGCEAIFTEHYVQAALYPGELCLSPEWLEPTHNTYEVYDQDPFFICKKCRRSWNSMTEMEDDNCFPDFKLDEFDE